MSVHDEDLARRFLEFRWIESWKGMKVYQDRAEQLRLEPFTEETIQETRRRYAELLSKYGDGFRGNYGWANSVVKPARGSDVTFKDIERAVGIDHLKPYYQWACQKIHVGCNTLHNSLGLMDDTDDQIMMAGPSNAGLCDPAHLAAISLHTATCALLSPPPSMDVLVGCKITEMLAEKIGDAFLRAHQQLEKEEVENQETADPSIADPEGTT